MKNWQTDNGKKSLGENAESNFFLMSWIFFRQSTMASCSILINKLDRILRKLKHDILVENINRLRTKFFTANHFIQMIRRSKNAKINTKFERIQFIVYGSPKSKYDFHEFYTWILPQMPSTKPRKFFMIENVSTDAWFLSLYSYWEKTRLLLRRPSRRLLGRFLLLLLSPRLWAPYHPSYPRRIRIVRYLPWMKMPPFLMSLKKLFYN